MRRVLAAGVLLAYNTWLLGPLVWRADAPPGYLSELAADDQPCQWIFRGGDLVTGLLLMTVALLGLRGWHAWLGRWAQRVSVALGVCGLATFADALGNMPCAPAADPTCQDTATFSGLVHVAASASVGAGFIAVLVFLTLGLRSRRAPEDQVRAALVATVALALISVVTVALIVLAPGHQLLPQAAQVLFSSVLAAWLALRLNGGGDTHERLTRPAV